MRDHGSPDDLPLVKRVAYQATIGRKTPRVPPHADVIWWRQLLDTDGEAVAFPG